MDTDNNESLAKRDNIEGEGNGDVGAENIASIR